MSVFRSIAMAFACFSVIPMPQGEWDERNMRYMMAAFPLVGACIGLVVWLWDLLCGQLGFGSVLRAAGFTLIPILISGGIHLDGFADVVDAQSSHAEPDRKREILKDPHAGAFAIIGVACYLLAYFGLATEVSPTHILALACVPVISRVFSGLATVSFEGSKQDGMLAKERDASSSGVVRVVLALLLLVVVALLAWQDFVVGASCIVVAAVVLATTKLFADRAFGGFSGDLAGFYLQVAELAMLAAIVFVGRVV